MLRSGEELASAGPVTRLAATLALTTRGAQGPRVSQGAAKVAMPVAHMAVAQAVGLASGPTDPSAPIVRAFGLEAPAALARASYLVVRLPAGVEAGAHEQLVAADADEALLVLQALAVLHPLDLTSAIEAAQATGATRPERPGPDLAAAITLPAILAVVGLAGRDRELHPGPTGRADASSRVPAAALGAKAAVPVRR